MGGDREYSVGDLKLKIDFAVSAVLKHMRQTGVFGTRIDPEDVFGMTVDLWATLGLSAEDILHIAQDAVALEIECRHRELSDELSREFKPNETIWRNAVSTQDKLTQQDIDDYNALPPHEKLKCWESYKRLEEAGDLEAGETDRLAKPEP